jgi:hypothetical protein
MAKNNKKQNNKKKSPVKPVIIACIALLAVAGIVITIVAINVNKGGSAVDLKYSMWISASAKNASGDEVDINEVYNTKYDNYQGRLSFNDKDGFELWLSPGSPDDGTHKGTYTIEGNKIKAVFDSGEKQDFTLIGQGNDISSIELNYNGYSVTFTKG